MAEWVEGIDVSVYQGAILQPSWDALYASGQRVAVVGSAHPHPNAYTSGNLSRAEAAGFVLATYVALSPGLTGATVVETGRQQCGPHWDKLAFVAVDCELNGITVAQIKQAVERVGALGQRPVIYTAHWWWVGHFGDKQDFKHVPLWNAYYDQQPDVDFAKLPYGGWTLDKVIGEQYAGSVQVDGVTVDRNSFRKDFVVPQPVPTDSQRLTALAILAQISETIAHRRELTHQQKALLRFLGS